MRIRMTLALLLLVGLPAFPCRADDADPEPPDNGRAALVGEWQLVSVKQGGNVIALPAQLVQVSIVFDRKGTITINAVGNAQKGTWKIDPRKKPAHIDITTDNKQAAPGIYKLDKGELTLASAEPGQARPKDFDAAQTSMTLTKKPK